MTEPQAASYVHVRCTIEQDVALPARALALNTMRGQVERLVGQGHSRNQDEGRCVRRIWQSELHSSVARQEQSRPGEGAGAVNSHQGLGSGAEREHGEP
jgi:hypothetical protein